MRLRDERGEGRLSTFIWLVVFLGVIYAGWHVGPIYLDHYSFKDKVVEICRLPRGTNTDEKLLDLLMKEVQERQLTAFLTRSSFRISTGENSRKIRLDYSREGEVLPGWKHRFAFHEEIDQPLLF